MKQKLISKLIFLLELIFIFVYSEDQNIDFDGIKDSQFTKSRINEVVKVTINLSSLPSYTKLSIYGSEDINYVISVFSDIRRENRIQLAQSFYKNSFLYLTKSQIISNKIYADVECSYTPCSYKFVVSAEDKISLKEGEQLYYYVSESNNNMEFEINLESEKVNIWSRGGRAIENNLSKYIARSNDGNYFLVDGNDKTSSFKVIGSKGDIINVGSIGYMEGLANKLVLADEETITVFLSKNEFPQACFRNGLRNEIAQKSLVFVEGVVKNNIIEIIKDINGQSENQTFTNGRFFKELNTNNLGDVKLCFTFPEEENFVNIQEIIFTFQLTLGKTSLKGQNFYEPQINGKMYLRNLISGNYDFFMGLEPEKNFKEINFNIFSEIGYTNLFMYKCENYPLCVYNKENIISNPRNIDRFTTYSLYKKDLNIEYNPINKNQILLMAYCVPGTQVLDFFCQFDTLIYSDEDTINIPENQYFNQYLLENEVDKFKIRTSGESNIININIDVIIYVGDVEIISNNDYENDYNHQHSSNKYFITIKLGKRSEILSDILFKVKAVKNSFYTIVVNFVRDDDISGITEKLQSGMNYLITIDPLNKENKKNANKIIKVYNDKYSDYLPFLVNFYSLNCKLDIDKKGKYLEENFYAYSPIDKFDYCSEDVKTINDDEYYDGEYEYKIEVTEDDFSTYNGKLCMLYVSAVEINKRHDFSTRDIIIPDNTPQQIMFNSYLKHISYAYVHANNEDDLIVKFNLIHKAKYLIKFYYEFDEGKSYNITSNNAIYLSHSEWKNQCPLKDELCYIIIDIYLDKIKDIKEPILELSVKSVNSNTVIYIPKNLLKIDYVQNKAIQYYYTEVGKNEIGFILVNFYRFSGKVFSRLVSKGQKAEANANWAGKYKFPTSEEESLKYDSFTKKINFNTAKEDCNDGCYLLICIQSDVKSSSSVDNFRNYPYSIIVQSALEDMSLYEFPPIKISTNEYIIGDLKKSNGNYMNEFYSLWINEDADKITFDFLSKAAGLYIKIGDKMTTTNKADFKFPPSGKDSIYTITKEEIKEITNSNSIKDLFLTIGIWTDMIDSVNTTIYSFIVHLESNKQHEIHRVSSDRKNLCEPSKLDNSDKYSYRCLFVIENYFIGELNNLLLYPILEDKSAGNQIYAEYIDPSEFEFGEPSFIDNKIPNNNSEFSTDKTKLNYLYIEKGLSNEKYLLVSVVSTKNTRIELLSTFYNYVDLITPNPSTSQLFLVKKDSSLTLNFPTDHLLIANLNSIAGSGQVYWEEDSDNKYYLIQQDYRISLSSLKNKNGKLIIKSTSTNTDYDIGAAFYLTYTVKYQKIFDELLLGGSVNFIYSENDFPIVLYTRLEDNDKDVEVFFTFYEMGDNSNDEVYNENSIQASAILVKEKTIYDIKSNPETNVDLSKSIKFTYDPAIRTGFIKIKKEELQNFNINKNDHPNLYIKLEKLNNNQNFKKLSLEITANQENNLVPVSEKIYQYGVLFENEDKKEYLLKTDLKRVNIVLVFSSTNNDLSLEMNSLSGKSLTKIKEENKNGKNIKFFNVDPSNDEIVKLIVSKNKSSKDKINFTFKYINTVDIKNFKEYEIENNVIQIQETKTQSSKNYKISLQPIKDYQNYKINYFVKLVDKSNKNIPIESISLIEEEKLLVKEFNNPNTVNGKLNLEFNNVEINPIYAQVIAQVYDNGINEFLSYKIYKFTEEKVVNDDDDDDDNKKYIVAIVIISVVLCLIIAGLIIALTFSKKANKNLMNEVNKISFSDEEGLTRGDKDDLLS